MRPTNPALCVSSNSPHTVSRPRRTKRRTMQQYNAEAAHPHTDAEDLDVARAAHTTTLLGARPHPHPDVDPHNRRRSS
jgi:hypothetical protein